MNNKILNVFFVVALWGMIQVFYAWHLHKRVMWYEIFIPALAYYVIIKFYWDNRKK